MNIYIFSYTKNGASICTKLMDFLPARGYAMEKYCTGNLKPIENLPENFLQSIFVQNSAIIFIGAVGIAVRKIAPFVTDKTTDPAVISIDEQGQYVIPLLAGHIGGANDLSQKLAAFLNAVPVITTATDLQKKFAVDSWAVKNELSILNPENIKHVSADILDNIPVGFVSDFPVETEIPAGITVRQDTQSGINISIYKNKQPFPFTLTLTPKCVIAGMGCRKGVSYALCQSLFLDALEELHIPVQAVSAIATLDLKKAEPALLQLSNQYGLDLIVYSAAELKNAAGQFQPSPFVERTIGVDNVCERAAVLAAHNGMLILGKKARCGVTVALAQRKYTVRW